MTGSMEIVLRTLTAFILLWLFIKIYGKQIISHKTYHLYIASITLGTIAGNLAFNIKIKFLYFVVAFVTMGFVVIILNTTALKSRTYRKWISGMPTTVIEKGQVLETNMRRMGYSFDSLSQALRHKGIFDFEEVEHALLEVNGDLSVLKKPQYRNITRNDLHILTPATMFPIELIMDGKMIKPDPGKEDYGTLLKEELTRRNISIKDVSYAVVGTNGRLYLDMYQDFPAKGTQEELAFIVKSD
ncbi:DUF421 domain-containing protein [Peribacillus saganii]|uniref:DUF421 domain-containing protein n=1 Tax=Peribacillus saganii TaxID=2303992 RepID=A0A372LMR9_9BACI|nr:DUF421 domain-containing protein [Peribacillus saganii]RFU67706.1 DUF421 domain-containing protein [Peribacillus saganii]